MNDATSTEEQEDGGGSGSQSKVLVAAIVAVALAAFVVQNTASTPVRWLVFDGSAPFLTMPPVAGTGAAISFGACGGAAATRPVH